MLFSTSIKISNESPQLIYQDSAIDCFGWRDFLQSHDGDVAAVQALLSHCTEDLSIILNSCKESFKAVSDANVEHKLLKLERILLRLLSVAKCLFNSKLHYFARQSAATIRSLLRNDADLTSERRNEVLTAVVDDIVRCVYSTYEACVFTAGLDVASFEGLLMRRTEEDELDALAFEPSDGTTSINTTPEGNLRSSYCESDIDEKSFSTNVSTSLRKLLDRVGGLFTALRMRVLRST